MRSYSAEFARPVTLLRRGGHMRRNCFVPTIIVACLVFGVGQGVTADEPTPANPIDKVLLDKLRKDSFHRVYASTPASPIDKVPLSPASPIDKVPLSPASPIDKVPLSPANPIDKVPLGPASPIDKVLLDKLRKDSFHRAYARFFFNLQLLRGHLPTPAEMKDFLAAGGTKRAATVEEVLTEAARENGWPKDFEQKVRTRILESLLNLDKEQAIDLFPGKGLESILRQSLSRSQSGTSN
jgi:hypothetical protein